MSQDTEPDKAGSHGEKTHDSNEGHVSNNADQPATDADQRDSDSTLRTRVTALILSGCALIAVGVFLTWTSGEGITLNGTFTGGV